ncbi:hypothetical protein COCON_G00067710 [Conger conger]|uniref:Uncharacterized protein n=1 Tax=Conger conger TaxID=82655 RepID=A0A9Q1DSN7_CONCO|nr:hypothetical protein COCON_G00067710 [Conger conger]
MHWRTSTLKLIYQWRTPEIVCPPLTSDRNIWTHTCSATLGTSEILHCHPMKTNALPAVAFRLLSEQILLLAEKIIFLFPWKLYCKGA